MLVFPAINAASFDEAKELIEKAVNFQQEPRWIHIDVADGQFTGNTTWGSPEDLLKLKDFLVSNKVGVEVHLMVAIPEEILEEWLTTQLIHRVIVHVEALTDPFAIMEMCKRYGAEAVLATIPGTSLDKISYLTNFKHFQVLAVSPGLAGQRFAPEVIDKIKTLRSKVPDATIEVDGGITPETGKQCKEAGADILVSASYIFSNPDPKAAYELLAKL